MKLPADAVTVNKCHCVLVKLHSTKSAVTSRTLLDGDLNVVAVFWGNPTLVDAPGKEDCQGSRGYVGSLLKT